MINEFATRDFTLPAINDKAHMFRGGQVADLINILAWAVKHDIPFLEVLAEYVPTNSKWGPPVSYAKMGRIEQSDKEPQEKKKSIWDIDISIGTTPWLRFMDNLKDGQSLSTSLYALKKFIPTYILDTIKEAEAKNNLKMTLPLLAERLHYDENSSQDFKTILMYPLVQLCSIFPVITGLMLFIIPNFKKIFDDLLCGQPLPKATELVINTSSFVGENFFSLSAIFVALFFLTVAVIRHGILFSLLFSVPFVGRLVKLFVLYDVAKSMNSYMTTGNDIIYAAKATMHYQRCIQVKFRLARFIKDVNAGCNWVDAWEHHMNFGSSVHLWMLRNAAAREKVAEGFVSLQNWLGEELHFFSNKIKVVFEFLLTLGNALIVGAIALAMFMPLTMMIEVLS